jgi:hypothetical protein
MKTIRFFTPPTGSYYTKRTDGRLILTINKIVELKIWIFFLSIKLNLFVVYSVVDLDPHSFGWSVPGSVLGMRIRIQQHGN